jgi:hypothetical protein
MVVPSGYVSSGMVPVCREAPITMDLPELADTPDAAAKLNVIVKAVASGRLLASQAEKLANLVIAQNKAQESGELAERVAALEKQATKEPTV